MDWATQTDNIALHLSQNKDDDIVHILQERYTLQRPVTFIGNDSCVVLGLHETGLSNQYAAHAEQQMSGDTVHILPPHILQVASESFNEMVHNQQNQTILFLGQSGSGKSSNRLVLTKQFIDLAKNGKKKSKVLSGASKMETALESFGCFKGKSPNNSGFGRYVEYQYSSSGRMVGVKLLDYGLQISRVTNAISLDDGHRTFHIFYQLLAGATPEQKQDLGLTDITSFYYTKGAGQQSSGGRASTLSRTLTLGRSKSLSRKSVSAHQDATPTDEDAKKFLVLCDHLKSLGIGKRSQSQIFKILAAILHLGNIIFFDDDEQKSQDPCSVKNPECLQQAATLLQVPFERLQNNLVYRSKTVGRDTFSTCLKSDDAARQRDKLAQTLYRLLFTWIVEHLNTRLCKPEEEVNTYLGVVDFPWHQECPAGSSSAQLETFYANYCIEKLVHQNNIHMFDETVDLLKTQGIQWSIQYPDNQWVVDVYDGSSQIRGLWSLFDSGLSLPVPANSTLGQEILAAADKELKPNPHYISSQRCPTISNGTGGKLPIFGVRHFMQGPSVDYDLESFIDEDAIINDFVALFRGTTTLEDGKTENTFLANLFSLNNGLLSAHNSNGIRHAKKTQEPIRRPSMKGRPSVAKSESQFGAAKSSVSLLLDSLKSTRQRNVYCINALDDQNQFYSGLLKEQVSLLNLRELALLKSKFDLDLSKSVSYDDFMRKYGELVSTSANARGVISAAEQVKSFISSQWWPQREVCFGNADVYLSIMKWRWLESTLKRIQGDALEEKRMSIAASEISNNWQKNGSFHDDDSFSDAESQMESEYGFDDEKRRTRIKTNDVEAGYRSVPQPVLKKEIIEKQENLTGTRRCWICCTWMLTWWIPGFCLGWCGMKRPDIRMAWREKVALCIIIMTLCASLIFFIVGLRYVICPPINVLTQEEVYAFRLPRIGTRPLQPYFSIYGRYIDATDLMASHKKSYGQGTGPGAIDDFLFEQYYGQDVSRFFFRQDAWDFYCPGINRPPDGWDNMDSTLDWQKRNGILEQFRTVHRTNAPGGTPQLYSDNLLQYTKGKVAWPWATIKGLSSETKTYIVLFDNVYYTTTMNVLDVFPPRVKELFGPNNQGKDISVQWKQARNANPELFDRSLRCINNMFYIGTVDKRDSLQCAFTNALLFGASIVLVAVIGVKFLAALQFGTKKEPEQADKFVILMVPCYTEGVESLTKTLDSLSTFRYDDKRKLLMVICDGMIIGSGNDRPTPRIVLDILGVDQTKDPEPLAFQSLGEGNKQYNMGKVYSGLYEVRGHSVPYIVVVKCGAPTERVKPGNRGKRDSQLIVMRYLNRVHFNAEFAPLELEMYHQMKNVIGVSPSFYEYILMVDADTEVESSSLNRMISVMVHDAKIMGLCGETKISNEKESWVTMIQVYEYFISHHMAKAFESLFGTVTCLPGCFSMYRIRTPHKNIPLLVSPAILEDYSENTVDTLHKKNLLHLGEDRYLTTLLLKHFPTMRTKFTGEARCYTVAPDRWNVLLSQRRRWINSTVHNLLELSALDQLCGFCCFSMRFVVMLDLFATFVQPATILYIGYLIYAVGTSRENFPVLSLILIAAIYGFQVIIFIAKREWQHIAWMFIYLAATPVISFYIPCYSFWHFDDFSWGNTRVVVGEGKKTVYVADAEPFDPKSIQLKRWRDFEENDLWEADSIISGSTATRSRAPTEYSNYSKKSDATYQSNDIPVRQGHLSMISLGTEGGIPGPFAAHQPIITDEILYREIKQCLVGADLMTLTKKQIRDQLSIKLRVDLRPKKEIMNRMIDEILSQV